MKYIFLINKFSVKDDTVELIKRINETCNKLNVEYVIEINSDEISTEDIVNKYKNSTNIIFAIGGDGTINRVLNGLVGTENVL